MLFTMRSLFGSLLFTFAASDSGCIYVDISDDPDNQLFVVPDVCQTGGAMYKCVDLNTVVFLDFNSSDCSGEPIPEATAWYNRSEGYNMNCDMKNGKDCMGIQREYDLNLDQRNCDDYKSFGYGDGYFVIGKCFISEGRGSMISCKKGEYMAGIQWYGKTCEGENWFENQTDGCHVGQDLQQTYYLETLRCPAD